MLLRSAEMRADADEGAFGEEELDGGEGGADAGVVGDAVVLYGNVEVTAEEDILGVECSVWEVLDGFLGHCEVGGVYCLLLGQ